MKPYAIGAASGAAVLRQLVVMATCLAPCLAFQVAMPLPSTSGAAASVPMTTRRLLIPRRHEAILRDRQNYYAVWSTSNLPLCSMVGSIVPILPETCSNSGGACLCDCYEEVLLPTVCR